MGTTDFAVPALELLVKAGHQVVAVVAQPDRPNQRGKKIKFLPVKQKAIELGIKVMQPERIKTPEAVAALKVLSADIFVVAAYGQILSEEILFMPPMGSINIHGSLLPKYRGAAPVHRAIIDGEKESGVTIMKMDIGMDTGDMLSKVKVDIDAHTTVGALHDTLALK
ncbi:MAG: methionyl-tRNA formyltransferase, partial [Eubacterium sp.]